MGRIGWIGWIQIIKRIGRIQIIKTSEGPRGGSFDSWNLLTADTIKSSKAKNPADASFTHFF